MSLTGTWIEVAFERKIEGPSYEEQVAQLPESAREALSQADSAAKRLKIMSQNKNRDPKPIRFWEDKNYLLNLDTGSRIKRSAQENVSEFMSVAGERCNRVNINISYENLKQTLKKEGLLLEVRR